MLPSGVGYTIETIGYSNGRVMGSLLRPIAGSE